MNRTIIGLTAVGLALGFGPRPAHAWMDCDVYARVINVDACRKANAKEEAMRAKERAERPPGWYVGSPCAYPMPSDLNPDNIERIMRNDGTLAWSHRYLKADGTIASVVIIDSSGRVSHFFNGPAACDDSL